MKICTTEIYWSLINIAYPYKHIIVVQILNDMEYSLQYFLMTKKKIKVAEWSLGT